MTNGLTFIPLKNFMDAVAEFYDDLELRQKVRTRRVFVATDDPSVIKEAKEKCVGKKVLMFQFMGLG